MSETKFLIKYTIKNDKIEEYLKIVKELNMIISAEGLLDYSVYADKKNKNNFTESYTFESEKDYDNYDDESDERVNILMSKMSELIVEKTTKYSVVTKINFDKSDL